MAEISKLFVTIGSKFDSSGINKAQKKFESFVKVAGTIAVAIGTTAAVAAAKFQKEMANVSTMLDSNTRQMLPQFKAKLLDLSVAYGETTATLSKGLYDILSAGIDASQAMEVLEASSIAAKAGMTDTGLAADALTTILNSYGLAATEASDVSDWFFSIVKRGKTTFDELAPTIGRVSSLAATAGLGMDELGAALATMTKSGVKTDEAITSLRGVLTAFLKPTKEGKDAAKALGVELSTETLKAEGLIPTLKKLEGATDNQVASIFGNVRALSGLSTILKDTSVYYGDLAVMQNRSGAAQEAFGETTDTVAFKFDQAKAAVNKLFVTLGERLLPSISEGIDFILELTNTLSQNEGMWRTVNKTISGVVKTIRGVAFAFKYVGNVAAIAMAKVTGNSEAAKIGWQELDDLILDFNKDLERTDYEIEKVARDQKKAEKTMTSATKKGAKERLAASMEETNIRRDMMIAWIEQKKFLEQEYFAWQREQAIVKFEEDMQHLNDRLMKTQEFYAGVMSVVNNYMAYKTQQIQNELSDELKSEDEKYNARKQWINENVTDEQRRNEMLDELEKGHSATVDNLRTASEQKEKQVKQKMKRWSIAEAVINTAVSVTKSFANFGWPVGAIMAALALAAGAIQIATIKAQRFAKGALIKEPTLATFAEEGPEVALPLNNPDTIKALSKALGSAGGAGNIINITVPPITTRGEARRLGEVIGDELMNRIKRSRKI